MDFFNPKLFITMHKPIKNNIYSNRFLFIYFTNEIKRQILNKRKINLKIQNLRLLFFFHSSVIQ